MLGCADDDGQVRVTDDGATQGAPWRYFIILTTLAREAGRAAVAIEMAARHGIINRHPQEHNPNTFQPEPDDGTTYLEYTDIPYT